jgi:hypothetical protein
MDHFVWTRTHQMTILSHLNSLHTFTPSTLNDGEERSKYEGVSKSFRTGRLERELQMVQLSAIRCSCIAIFCELV